MQYSYPIAAMLQCHNKLEHVSLGNELASFGLQTIVTLRAMKVPMMCYSFSCISNKRMDFQFGCIFHYNGSNVQILIYLNNIMLYLQPVSSNNISTVCLVVELCRTLTTEY